jgi:probable Rubsico expression protein CbbX
MNLMQRFLGASVLFVCHALPIENTDKPHVQSDLTALGNLFLAASRIRNIRPRSNLQKIAMQAKATFGRDMDEGKKEVMKQRGHIDMGTAGERKRRREIAEEVSARQAEMEEAREEKEEKIAAVDEIDLDDEFDDLDDFMYTDQVQEIIDKLEYDMVGMKPIKDRIQEIASLLVIDKMRMSLGLESAVPSLNMVFTGSPGTGKTTVALRMGEILQKMGYSRKGHVVVATRDDLVGQFLGQTAPKTMDVIMKSVGGILLIDEAYYLYNAESPGDFGVESLEVILKMMDNKKVRDDLIVVLAGYEDRMDTFFGYVPGMKARIGMEINFPDYGTKALGEIAGVFLRDQGYTADPAFFHEVEKYMEIRRTLPFFANARTVRNFIDMAKMKNSERIFNEKMDIGPGAEVSAEEITHLTLADVSTKEELDKDGGAHFEEQTYNSLDAQLTYGQEDEEYPWELDHMHWRHDPDSDEMKAISEAKRQELEEAGYSNPR